MKLILEDFFPTIYLRTFTHYMYSAITHFYWRLKLEGWKRFNPKTMKRINFRQWKKRSHPVPWVRSKTEALLSETAFFFFYTVIRMKINFYLLILYRILNFYDVDLNVWNLEIGTRFHFETSFLRLINRFLFISLILYC